MENIVALPICIYLTWVGWDWVTSKKAQGTVRWLDATHSYEEWIVVLIVPIGFGLAALFYLERLVRQAWPLLVRIWGEGGGGGGVKKAMRSLRDLPLRTLRSLARRLAVWS